MPSRITSWFHLSSKIKISSRPEKVQHPSLAATNPCGNFFSMTELEKNTAVHLPGTITNRYYVFLVSRTEFQKAVAINYVHIGIGITLLNPAIRDVLGRLSHDPHIVIGTCTYRLAMSRISPRVPLA